MGREDLRRPLLNCRNRPPQRPECSHRLPRCPGTTRGRCRKYANRVRWVSSYQIVVIGQIDPHTERKYLRGEVEVEVEVEFEFEFQLEVEVEVDVDVEEK